MPNWLLYVVPCCIWGSTWLVIKYQYGIVAPEVSVVYRFAAASAILFAWCVARGEKMRYSKGIHAQLLLTGILQFAANYVFVYLAEQYLTSGLVAVVFVMMVFWPELAELRGDLAQIKGLTFAVLGTIAASAGNLSTQRLYGRGVGVQPCTAWGMLYGTAATTLYCIAAGIPFNWDGSAGYVVSLSYLTLFGSVIAFGAYLTLLKRIGAGRAGYTSAVIPVVAMLISTLFEDYVWTAPAVAGMALVLLGNVLYIWKR
jgi:drug/metabolite transporter (DMT)-like permease